VGRLELVGEWRSTLIEAGEERMDGGFLEGGGEPGNEITFEM